MSERVLKYAELIELVLKVRLLLDTPRTDVTSSRFENVEEALEYLDSCIESLRLGKTKVLDDLKLLFAPTGSLQEISISSGWGNEFIEISRRFDATLTLLKSGEKLKESL